MPCLFLFHFQVYLIYLLYCPHGVLGVITFPLCPSASTSDSDGNWCFPFHQWTFSHQSLSLLSFISIILKFYTQEKRTDTTYIYIYIYEKRTKYKQNHEPRQPQYAMRTGQCLPCSRGQDGKCEKESGSNFFQEEKKNKRPEGRRGIFPFPLVFLVRLRGLAEINTCTGPMF